MVRGLGEKMFERLMILRQHHKAWRKENGRLLALEEIHYRDGRVVSRWVDVTHWSHRRLLWWLGY